MPRVNGRADSRLRGIVKNYCAAVDADATAHPIQLASKCIPVDLFGKDYFQTVSDLYEYTVCAYDAGGFPLMPTAPVEDVVWILMDHVYVRGEPHRHPTTAARERGLRLGFEAKGRRDTDQALARRFWKAAVQEWGEPTQLR